MKFQRTLRMCYILLPFRNTGLACVRELILRRPDPRTVFVRKLDPLGAPSKGQVCVANLLRSNLGTSGQNEPEALLKRF